MKTLTEKQKNILEFIEEFLDREGMAPTVYEIAAHFDIKTSTVFAHLRALQRKKQLSRSSKARSISLINRPNSRNKVPQGALLIPLLGRVNAGAPAESLEYKEGEVCISSTLAPDCRRKICSRCASREKACATSASTKAISSSSPRPP